MAKWDVESVAAELLACEAERREREPFTDDWPDLDLATGYQIQDLNLTKRLARGEKLIGVKLGLTSRAKQQRMGVDTPFVAWLTDDMILPVGDPVPQSKLIHPRIEPEIVFVMGERLEGPGRHLRPSDGGREHRLRRCRGHRQPLSQFPVQCRVTSPPTTPPPGPSSPARSGSHPSSIDLGPRQFSSRSTAKLVDTAPAPRCRDTRERRSRWRPTIWRAAAWPSRPDGSSSPAASPTPCSHHPGHRRLPLHPPGIGLHPRRQLMPIVEITLAEGRATREDPGPDHHARPKPSVAASTCAQGAVRVIVREVPKPTGPQAMSPSRTSVPAAD